MAKFRSIVGELSGSIGGQTYSHNKGGPYMRLRSIPTNPTSTRQTFVRANLATLSRRWSATLTGTQRSQWSQYAADNPVTNVFGDPIQLTGQQAYLKLGLRLLSVGLAINDTAPSSTPVMQLLSYAAVMSAATQDIVLTYTATPLPAGILMVVCHTPPGKAGTNPNDRGARFAGNTAPAAASPQTVSVWTPFSAGQRVNVYICLMDSKGQQSPMMKMAVTTGA